MTGEIQTNFMPKTEVVIEHVIEKMDIEGKKYYQKGLQNIKKVFTSASKYGIKLKK